MGCTETPSKGVDAPHQCSRGIKNGVDESSMSLANEKFASVTLDSTVIACWKRDGTSSNRSAHVTINSRVTALPTSERMVVVWPMIQVLQSNQSGVVHARQQMHCHRCPATGLVFRTA